MGEVQYLVRAVLLRHPCRCRLVHVGIRIQHLSKASMTSGMTRSVSTPVSCTITVIRYLSVPAATLNNEPRVEIITYVHSLRLLS